MHSDVFMDDLISGVMREEGVYRNKIYDFIIVEDEYVVIYYTIFLLLHVWNFLYKMFLKKH